MDMSNREQKRLEAAEHVCRAFREAVSYYATQQQYMNVALDWLLVWIKHCPKRVAKIPVQRPPRRRTST